MTEQTASYKHQVVYDYKGNPLIESLPVIWSYNEVIDMLSYNDGQHDGERELDAHYRMHCVHRLFRYFQPLEQHIDIEQRLSRCIRQGYLHRNPQKADYARALDEGHKIVNMHGTYNQFNAFHPTATGFTIIGMSGIGKTTAVVNILNMYPQVINHARYHDAPLVLKQLVWLKLECPPDGSVKGLCMSFFEAVDRAIGTDYFESFRTRGTIDYMMVRMTQAARLHCLGVLVIDEIQNLSLIKSGGQAKMLNFFVTLVNTIGVPVILIGTSKALPILQSEFRQARRGSGQGDLIWDRMKNDYIWEIFVKSMWRNQWTQNKVVLTDGFRDALYEESQGITDIAIKIYAMVQIRAIGLGNETFSPSDLHIVAQEKLGLVKPMLDALRSGDKKKINMYGDIASISIEDYYKAYAALLNYGQAVPLKRNEMSLSEKAVLKLLELGVEPVTAKRLTGEMTLLHKELRTVQDIVRLAYQKYLAGAPPASDIDCSASDLRNADNYESLKEAGAIQSIEW